MNNKLTPKERIKVWNSYTDEQKRLLHRIIEIFAPGSIYTIERW